MSVLIVPPLVYAAAQTDGAKNAVQENLQCQDMGQLVIIGEAEYVSLSDKSQKSLRLKARIDTGAQTSSLGVMDFELFERDGNKWVTFSVADEMNNRIIEFKRPLARMIKIKQHGKKALERPVVRMLISLKGKPLNAEFSLADRSRFQYPVLIGRNVLRSHFLVDVSRQYTSSHISER